MSAPSPTPDRWMPGDPDPQQQIERMIRVNQAGEYGAVRIYQGQISVLGKSACGSVLRHMAEQEKQHLDAFNRLAVERRVRPTLLQPLWHVAGFALGAATAFLGERAAMACTVAVEEVIEEHYAEQAAALGAEEKDLKDTIQRFRDEELEHRDIGLQHEADLAPAYPLLTQAIKAGSRLAIWLSTRV